MKREIAVLARNIFIALKGFIAIRATNESFGFFYLF